MSFRHRIANQNRDRPRFNSAETDEEIRLISMRKAERNEQEIYYSNL